MRKDLTYLFIIVLLTIGGTWLGIERHKYKNTVSIKPPIITVRDTVMIYPADHSKVEAVLTGKIKKIEIFRNRAEKKAHRYKNMNASLVSALERLKNLNIALKDSVQTLDYYLTPFYLTRKPFNATLMTYSFMPTDSIQFTYKMEQSYVDSIFFQGIAKGSQIHATYPTWKKVMYGVAGAAFTGGIVWLVK